MIGMLSSTRASRRQCHGRNAGDGDEELIPILARTLVVSPKTKANHVPSELLARPRCTKSRARIRLHSCGSVVETAYDESSANRRNGFRRRRIGAFVEGRGT